MGIEIPAELLLPTIEELLNKTDDDLKKKWKPCNRLGKKERKAAKSAKSACPKNLGSLFVKDEKPKPLPSAAKPVLRVTLASQNQTPSSLPHKRSRPPK